MVVGCEDVPFFFYQGKQLIKATTLIHLVAITHDPHGVTGRSCYENVKKMIGLVHLRLNRFAPHETSAERALPVGIISSETKRLKEKE